MATTERKPPGKTPPPGARPSGKPLTQKQRRNQAAARSVSPSHRPPWQSPTVITSVSVGIVAVVLIVIVIINQIGSNGNTSAINSPIPSNVADVVFHPDASVIEAVGSGGQSGEMIRLPASAKLTGADNKPLVVFVGAEYCPYCAAERWTMVYWLSQFGTFKNLSLTQSSASDTDPDTDTFSFYKSSYSSQYIDLSTTELDDRNEQPLQSLSAEASSVFTTYDTPPYTAESGQFPFLDIGGMYTLYSTSYDPALLANLTWAQIATKLKDPTDPVTIAIVGNANILTAATCVATGDLPASVCSTSTIQAIEPALKALKTPSA